MITSQPTNPTVNGEVSYLDNLVNTVPLVQAERLNRENRVVIRFIVELPKLKVPSGPTMLPMLIRFDEAGGNCV